MFELNTLNDDELWLLRQFSCLPQDYHSHDVISHLIDPESHGKATQFTATLEFLTEQGWIVRDKTETKYKVHPAVVDLVRQMHPITAGDILPMVHTLTSLLQVEAGAPEENGTFQWVPYGLALRSISPGGAPHKFAAFLSNLGLRIRDQGDLETARGVFEEAVQLDVQTHGTHHPTTANRYTNLAMILQALGELDEAKKCLARAMNAMEHLYGESHQKTAVSYANLAKVLNEMGDFENAKSLFVKALRIEEETLGADHPVTATSYSNLAKVLRKIGDPEKAKLLMEQALRANLKQYGRDDPRTATCYTNLALIYLDTGNEEEALTLASKAVEVFERKLPDDHPQLEKARSILANVTAAIG